MDIIETDSLEKFPIPVIHLKGNSSERGYQYGKAAGSLIKKAISTYHGIVLEMRKEIVWENVLEEVKPFMTGLKRYDKPLYQELEGIAAGAGVTLPEIVFLNARSEIMNPVWMKAAPREGCTSFAVMPEKTEQGEFFLGQTYDWYCNCRDLLVLLHCEDESGHEFITITEAGIIAKIGCNNYGVANLLNYLNNFEVDRDGTPYNILLRRVLDSKSAYEAQRNIMRSPIAFGLNIFIADRKGFAVDYELTARGIDFFYPENGLLLHTNHFLSSKLITRNIHKQMYPNSLHRYAIAGNFLKKETISLEDLFGLTAYHDINDCDNNICRHSSDSAFFLETIFTMILELKDLHMYLCFDPPCSHAFYKIDLKKIFRKVYA